MATLNKLHVYFYNSDNTVTRKLQMFNAILRSKVLYGLETLVMNTSVQSKLNTFQLKTLRNILKIPTTYIDRELSNDYVKGQLNKQLKLAKKKPMLTLTEYHTRQRVAYLARLIKAGDSDPGTPITFDPVTLKPIDHGKLRVGQPRQIWYKTTLEYMWQTVRQNIPYVNISGQLNLDTPAHVRAIKEYANKGHT